MKFKYILPAAAIAATMGFTSCVGDLDVDPTIDQSTIMEFDRNAVFTKIYANMALTGQQGPSGSADIDGIDEGTSDYVRQMWNMNELPTDETHCCWGDAGIPEYNHATWDASHNMVTGMYYRLYFGITVANYFLSQTEGATEAEVVQQRAEARFLRALNYYFAMDFYGNVPFLTTLSTENAPQAQRADVYAFVEKELLEIEPDLAAAQTNTYGRADVVADWMLLARLYLNAEVYTGKANWEKAKEYAKKAMDSSYKLHTTGLNGYSAYKTLFMGDNDSNGAQEEIVLPIMQDGVLTQSYGCTNFLVDATHKDDMGFQGTSENWAGVRATKQMIVKFFPTGTVPAEETDKMVKAAKDDRCLFYGKDRNLNIKSESTFTDGYSSDKFTNNYASGASPKDSKFVDTDFPMFRLAEAYLTYAEASKRLGDDDDCKAAIDALRDRANANKQPSYTLTDILDEWAREFSYEGRRRMDLVRFGKFGGSTDYLWEWKGGVADGTNFSKDRNIYGIPTQDLNANQNLVQNPGY